jgi:hypothetical protein
MSKTIPLLPCPFCGETLVPTQDEDGFTHNRRVRRANSCFISWLVVRYPHHVEWNTRVTRDGKAFIVTTTI